MMLDWCGAERESNRELMQCLETKPSTRLFGVDLKMGLTQNDCLNGKLMIRQWIDSSFYGYLNRFE